MDSGSFAMARPAVLPLTGSTTRRQSPANPFAQAPPAAATGGETLAGPLTLMLTSALCLSLSGLFAKIAMSSVSTLGAVTSRFALPLLLMATWLVVTHQVSALRLGGFRQNLARGVALCASQYLLYVTMLHMSLAEATILYNTGPLFITLHSVITTRALSRRLFVSLAIGAAGVCLMMHVERSTANAYALTGILSGFCLAVSQIQLHRAAQKENPGIVMFWTYAVGFVLCALVAPFRTSTLLDDVLRLPFHGVAACLVLAALGSMGNQMFRTEAYRRVTDPATLSPLIYSTVLISVVLDAVAYGVIPDLQVAAGGLCIVGSALLTPRKRPLGEGSPRHPATGSPS